MAQLDFTTTPLPANGQARSASALAAIFNNIRTTYNADDTILSAATAENTAGAIVKRGATNNEIGVGYITANPPAAGANSIIFTTVPTGHTGNPIQAVAQVGLANIFAVGVQGNVTAIGQLIMGSGAKTVTTPAGLLDMTQASGILPVANGGSGLATLAAGRLPLGAGPSAMTALAGSAAGQVVAWDVTLNGGTGGWAAAGFSGGNLAYNTVSPGVFTDNAIVAGGTSALTVTQSAFVDKAGVSHTWLAATFTLGAGIAAAVTAPSGGTQWVTVYRDPADLVNPKFVVSAINAPTPPAMPTGDMYALAGYLLMRSGSLLIDQTDQHGTSGYVVDGRTRYQANILGTATGGLIPISGGGTSANTAAGALLALGAAASGVNADISQLSGPSAATGVTITNLKTINTNFSVGSASNNLGHVGIGAGAATNYLLNLSQNDQSASPLYIVGNSQSYANVTPGWSLAHADGFYYTDYSAANYTALGGVFGTGIFGVSTDLTYGSPTQAGYGGATGISARVHVNNVSQLFGAGEFAGQSELCLFAGVLDVVPNYPAQNGATFGAAPGRYWGGDITVKGPTNNPSALIGWSIQVVNNIDKSPYGTGAATLARYDPLEPAGVGPGSPNTNNSSSGLGIYAAFGSAGVSTYPVDNGLWIGGVTGLGGSVYSAYKRGILIGGHGTPYTWINGTSQLDTGILIRDTVNSGIEIMKKIAATANVALSVHASAGPSVFGGTVDTLYTNVSTAGVGSVKSTVQIGDNFFNSTANQALPFSVNGGALGTAYSAGSIGGSNFVNIASFGVGATDVASLSIRAARNINGNALAAGTAVGFSVDANAGAQTGPALWGTQTGWGFGLGNNAVLPQHIVDVWGNVHVTNPTTTTHAHILPSTPGTVTAGNVATSSVIPGYYDFYTLYPTGNITGITVGNGAYDGQELKVTNISAFTIAFFGTQSNFANGLVPATIAAYGSHTWRWAATLGLWYIIS